MLLSTESPAANPWWVAIATTGAMLVGAVLKTFVDLVRSRDDGQAKWRADVMSEMQKLRDWNAHQQEQLDKYQARIGELEKSVQGEQVLRHEIRGQLHKEQMAHELLKAEHAHSLKECEQHRHDLEILRVEHAKLQVEHDRLINPKAEVKQ